jgi:hypothetical protein
MAGGEASLNNKLRGILKRADIDIKASDLQESIREFNQFDMAITARVQDIINSPAEFIKYLRKKEEHS